MACQGKGQQSHASYYNSQQPLQTQLVGTHHCSTCSLLPAFLPATNSWTSLPINLNVRQKSRDIPQTPLILAETGQEGLTMLLRWHIEKAAASCMGKPHPQLGELKPLSWAFHHCLGLLRRDSALAQHSTPSTEITALPVAALTLLPCTHHTQYHPSVALNDQRHWATLETETLSC